LPAVINGFFPLIHGKTSPIAADQPVLHTTGRIRRMYDNLAAYFSAIESWRKGFKPNLTTSALPNL
jgi:hypothetical protein